MGDRLLRRSLLGGAECAVDALAVPGGQIRGFGQAVEHIPHVRIELRIGLQHRVVHIPGRLAPGVEGYLLVGVVRVQGDHDPPHRIIQQCRTHPDAVGELEIVRGAEKRFVLADRLALVVEDSPATAYPARRDHQPPATIGPGSACTFF